MANVSTRPQKGATPVTKAATAVTASKADTAAAPIEDERPSSEAINAAAFTALSDILRSASNTDEAVQYTGNSDRLLRIAADLAAHAPTDPGTAQNHAFDIAALVSAALRVPGDIASEQRAGHIASAKSLLLVLTECETALDDDVPADEVAAAEKPADKSVLNAEQLRCVLGTVASRTDTLAQMLRVMQSTDTTEEWTLSVLIDAAEQAARSIGAIADGAIGGGVVGDADTWNHGRSFATTGKKVEA